MFWIKPTIYKLLIIILILGLGVVIFLGFLNQPKAIPKPLVQSEFPSTNTTSKALEPYLQTDLKPRFTAKIELNPEIWTTEFNMDKGEFDGVKFGNVVTNTKGQVIGLIVKTDLNTSVVSSLASLKTNLPVTVGNPDNKGLLTGLYGYGTEVNWLQNGENLDNQPVYTSSFSKNTQGNLLIGLAQNTQLGKSGSFYRVDVSDLANIWQTDEIVLVW